MYSKESRNALIRLFSLCSAGLILNLLLSNFVKMSHLEIVSTGTLLKSVIIPIKFFAEMKQIT